jgi:hypothetical protein
VGRATTKEEQGQQQIPSGMTTRKANATAKAKGGSLGYAVNKKGEMQMKKPNAAAKGSQIQLQETRQMRVG